MKIIRNRNNNGKYDFEELDLVCNCGHSLGEHAAKNDTNTRPCFYEESNCDCKNFIKK